MTVPDPQAFPQLSEEDRAALSDYSRQPPGALRLRSSIVLACAEGLTNTEVAQRLQVSPATVAKWRDRYLRRGMAGLSDAPRSGRPRSVTRQGAEAHIAAVLAQAENGSPVPSTRALSDTLGLSQSTVARIWREQAAGLSEPPRPRNGKRGPGAEQDGDGLGCRSRRAYRANCSPTRCTRCCATGSSAVSSCRGSAWWSRRSPAGSAPARPRPERRSSGWRTRVWWSPSRTAARASRGSPSGRPRTYATSGSCSRSTWPAVSCGRLDAEHTRLLTDDVTQLRRAVNKGDIAAFRSADMSFHRHVCEAARNDALIRLWRMIESSLWDLHVLGDPRYVGGWGALAEHHAELLDVLRSGDPDVAGPMFAAHAAGEVDRYLPGQAEPGAPSGQ